MSNTPQIVCMGSYGDLCIILPYAYAEFKRTGEKLTIIVAQNYADMLDGVSYVNRVVYPESWKRGLDLANTRKAVDWVKGQADRTPITWVNPVEAFGERKNSGHNFVDEMWKTLGAPDGWKNAPLVFDQRDDHRELVLAGDARCQFDRLNNQSPVLVALKGVASPFPECDDLMAMIKSIPGVNVVNLSEIKADKPYDLLGLMDRAQLLIASDSMPLHLSAASKVPVIALSRDLPSHWNGTPWHRRYELHVRYSQYAARKSEILHTARRVLQGERRLVQRPITGTEGNGYNPSLVRWQGRLFTTYRYHAPGTWRTKLALALLNEKTMAVEVHYTILTPSSASHHSAEDMRLWTVGNKLFGSYVLANTVGNKLKCAIRYGEITITGNGAELSGDWQPKYGNNDGTALEKNWVFFEREGCTFFIYACYPDHIVALVKENYVVQSWKTLGMTWPWGTIRGGTAPLPFRGKWLRFFHSQMPISDKPRDARYYMGAYLMNSQPPFEMLAVSTHPILAGHEWRSAASHWKPNVVIPYGAVEQDGGWMVSVGVNDSAACLVNVTEKDLNL